MREIPNTELPLPDKWGRMLEVCRKEHRYFYLQQENHAWTQNISAPPMSSKLLLYCDIAGEHELREKHHSYLGCPDFMSLRCIVAGNELVRYNGKLYLTEPGDFMLFHPGRDFEYATGPAKFCHVRSITMKGRLSENILEQADLRNLVFFHPADPAFFTTAFEELREMFLAPEKTDPVNNAGIAFRLIQTLAQLAGQQGEPAELTEIRRYIDLHPEADLSLRALSGKFNRSSTYLNSIFRRYLHVSVHEYVENSRMRTAMEMLQRMNSSVKETAAALGFSSQFNFSTRFRRYWGYPPKKVLSRRS